MRRWLSTLAVLCVIVCGVLYRERSPDTRLRYRMYKVEALATEYRVSRSDSCEQQRTQQSQAIHGLLSMRCVLVY